MTEIALERPAWRISFGRMTAVALGLAALAFVGGRHIYTTYGGYRPLALVHVPQSMRYRARVELNDPNREPALAVLLRAADPRGVRAPELRKKLGGAVLREVAFGAGVAPKAPKGVALPSDFVVVLGLQQVEGLDPKAETGPQSAKIVCEVLAEDGIPSQSTATGCRLSDGAVVAGTAEGAVVLASRAALIRDLLERPDIGDRMGFSGPSVRGTAPEPVELARETEALARVIAAKYP